jgi:DNA helicase II / ATP-dependent DNA helicase PcrA
VLEGGYGEHLRAELSADERRSDDLRQLAEYASRASSLSAFLEELALVSELAAEDGGSPGEPPDELLTLSSVHQAKGLEWRAVFVIWLAEGRFPLAAATRLPEEEEEERRLFYVAATRAKDELALVYPLMAAPQERERVILRVSRFISELPADGPPVGEGGQESLYDRLLLEPMAVQAVPGMAASPPAQLAPGKEPGPDVPF